MWVCVVLWQWLKMLKLLVLWASSFHFQDFFLFSPGVIPFNLKCALYRRHLDNTRRTTSHQPHTIYTIYSFLIVCAAWFAFRFAHTRPFCASVGCELQMPSFCFCLILVLQIYNDEIGMAWLETWVKCWFNVTQSSNINGMGWNTFYRTVSWHKICEIFLPC